MKNFFSVLRIYFPSWKFFDFATPEHFEFEFAFLNETQGENQELKWKRLPSRRRAFKHLFHNPFENMRTYVFSRLDVLMREKSRLSAGELLQVDGLAKTLIYSFEDLHGVSTDDAQGAAQQFRYRLLLLDLSEQISSDKGMQTSILYTSPPLEWEPE